MKEYKVTMQYLRSIGYGGKTAHQILKAYGVVADLKREDYPGMEYYYRITEFVQRDFTTFLRFYGAVKCHYREQRQNFTKQQSNWRIRVPQEVEMW